jgi:hypothetical protein
LSAAYGSGATILQAGLQNRWLPLAQMCEAMACECFAFGIPLAEAPGTNAYLTPAHSRGFHLHYDNHCALVLQVEGVKNWTVFSPNLQVPVERCVQPIQRGDLGPPIAEIRLEAGDVLYVPRGFPHLATAGDCESLHVTVSLRPVVKAEAILADRLNEPSFRRSVVLGRDTDGKRHDQFSSASNGAFDFDQTSVRCAERQLSATKLSSLPLLRTRPLKSHSADQITQESVLRRLSPIICVETSSEELEVHFLGAAIRLPKQMKSAVDFIAAKLQFTPSQFPIADAAPSESLAFARLLVRRGLFEIVSVKSELAT